MPKKGRQSHWRPTPITERDASPRIAAHVCKHRIITWNCISKVPTQNNFHQLRLTILLEKSYSIQESYYKQQFNKILLHTHKFLEHTLCRKTWYFRPFSASERLSTPVPLPRLNNLDPAGGLPTPGPRPHTSSPNVRYKSPPLSRVQTLVLGVELEAFTTSLLNKTTEILYDRNHLTHVSTIESIVLSCSLRGRPDSLRMTALRPASQAGPMRNPREGEVA